LLAAADPAALLVPPRLLRRVIKHDRKITGLGLQVPHRKSYVIGRDALLALADRDELGLEPDRDLPPTVLLLARPEPEELAAWPGADCGRVARVLADAVAAAALFAATRPAGAPDSEYVVDTPDQPERPEPPESAASVVSPEPAPAMTARAERAAAVGNVVRAA